MSYLSPEELQSFGFKSLGQNVLVSSKASFYNCEMISIGNNSRIDDFCVISGLVVIGDYCHITPMCLVAGGVPGVYLANFTTLAYGVKIFSQSDDYSGETMTNSLIPKKFKNEKFGSVHLEQHVIIGAGATVFPGVTISEGCAIGSMALVSKNTAPWGIYAGCPARRIKERKKNVLELATQFIKEKMHDSF